MTVRELVQKLDAKILAGEEGLERQIKSGYICDLLSWVMSHAQKGNVWITVQSHVNIVAVALLTEVACIIIPENIEVDTLTITKANEEGIPILSSALNSYELACKLKELI
ncbi:MAG: hypothetical protein PWP27_1899 [Clostridiales bacterium]|jgi:predicted transcriptional regulator|nr:hypothetical protein [Clostridiales bacterium]MDK2934089.1 hypothetical protein [Clostridiales bacterium]